MCLKFPPVWSWGALLCKVDGFVFGSLERMVVRGPVRMRTCAVTVNLLITKRLQRGLVDLVYRNTSLITSRKTLGPYSRPIYGPTVVLRGAPGASVLYSMSQVRKRSVIGGSTRGGSRPLEQVA